MGIGEKHQQRGQEGHPHGDAEAHEGLAHGVRAGSLDHRTESHVGCLPTAGMGRRRALS